ncbi:MAG: hypothetical protein ACKPKO_45205, partial [Candidatus Fonsibacter sp.]
IFQIFVVRVDDNLRRDVCGRYGIHETAPLSGQFMTLLEPRAVHDEVHGRYAIALLQRVPQAFLGRIQVLE